MAQEVRICNPFEIDAFREYQNTGFVGFASDIDNEFIYDMAKGANLTINIRSQKDGIGEPLNDSDDSFSGCIGLVQRNLSDMLLDEVIYPSAATNIQQGYMSTDIFTRFFSFYNPSGQEESQAVQLESCFTSFSKEVWFLCFMTSLIILFLLVVHITVRQAMVIRRRPNKIAPSNRYILYQVLTHMTKFGQLWCDTGAFRKISFLCLSVFSYFILFYLSAMMSTEKVVVKTPDMFRSYKDILDREIALSFLLFSDIYVQFKYAKPNTVENRLWRMTLSKHTERDIFVETHEDTLGKALAQVLSREIAGVTDTSWAPFMLHHMCNIVVDQDVIDRVAGAMKFTPFKAKSIYPYLGHGDDAAGMMRGFILTATPTGPIKRIKCFLRRLLETGYLAKKSSRVGEIDLFKEFYPSRVKIIANDPDYQQCDRNELIMPQVNLESTGLQNIKNLLFIIFTIYSTLCLVLILELVIHRVSARQRKRVPRCHAHFFVRINHRAVAAQS